MAVTGTHQFGTGIGTGATSGMSTGVSTGISTGSPTSMPIGYARGGFIKPPRPPRMSRAPKPPHGGGRSKSAKPSRAPRQPKPPQTSGDQDRLPNIAPPPDQPYAQPDMPYAQPDMPYASSASDQDAGPASAPQNGSNGSQDTDNPTGYARGGMVRRRKRRSRSGRRFQEGGPVDPEMAPAEMLRALRGGQRDPSYDTMDDTSDITSGYAQGGYVRRYQAGGPVGGGVIGSPPPGGTPTGRFNTGAMSGGVIGSPPPGGMPTGGTTSTLPGGVIGSPPPGGAPTGAYTSGMASPGAFGAGPMRPAGTNTRTLGGGVIGSPPPGGTPTGRFNTGTLPGGVIGSPPPGGTPTGRFNTGAMPGGVIGSPPPGGTPTGRFNSAMYLSGLGAQRPTGYARGGLVKDYQDGGDVEDDEDQQQFVAPSQGGGDDQNQAQTDDQQSQQDDSWWSAPQRVLQRMHDAIFSPAEAAEASDHPRAAAATSDEGIPDYSQPVLPAPGTPEEQQAPQDQGLLGRLGQWFTSGYNKPEESKVATGFLDFFDPNRRLKAAGLPFPGRSDAGKPPVQQNLPDNSAYRMLAGSGAPPRDYVENNLNNIIQANPGMTMAQAVHKFVADPEVSGQPDLAEQHMDGVRGMQLERLGIGRVEYDNAVRTNNPQLMDVALQRLSEAHDYVPDGKRAAYTRDPGSGDILASVEGGQPVRFSPQQFGTFIHGPGMQFDHLMVNGVENHVDMGSNHGKPAGEVAQGGQQAAQGTGYGAPIDLRNMTRASREALSKAQIVMGLTPGTTQGLPTGYAAGQAQAPSAADYDEGKRLGLTDREAQLRAEIMQTRASGRGGPVNWNEIAPPGAPQPPRIPGPVQYAMFGGGATTGDPRRISSQYFNPDEQNRVWSTIPAQQNPAQALEQTLGNRQLPVQTTQAQGQWQPTYGRGTSGVPPSAGDTSLEATAARLFPSADQAPQRQQFVQKGMAAQAAGAEKERLVAIQEAAKAAAKSGDLGATEAQRLNNILRYKSDYLKAISSTSKEKALQQFPQMPAMDAELERITQGWGARAAPAGVPAVAPAGTSASPAATKTATPAQPPSGTFMPPPDWQKSQRLMQYRDPRTGHLYDLNGRRIQ